MIRLSRAGWNNVIIYVVMAFILLINMTQNKQEQASEQLISSASLIEDHEIILTLTVNQLVSIERIGQTWRSLPNVIAGQPLEQMMSTWHDVALQSIGKPEYFDKAKATIVSALIAGQSDLYYFMLLPTPDALLVVKQTPSGETYWFQGERQLYQQLLPVSVLQTQEVY